MAQITIKLPTKKKLSQVEIIRAENLAGREISAYTPPEEKAPNQDDPNGMPFEGFDEGEGLFDEEFAGELIREAEESKITKEPPRFYDYYSVCAPGSPVDIDLSKIPKEESLPLSEVREEVQHAYDRGFDDAQQLTTNTFETQMLKLQERVKEFDLIAADLKEKFSGELEEIGKSIAAISVMVAGHILGREIQSDSMIVVEQAKKAIEALDKEDIFEIQVHPDSMSLLEEVRLTLDYGHSKMKKTLIAPNESIGKGGCILYTSAGMIDARIKSQLAQLEKQMSQVSIDISDKEKSLQGENQGRPEDQDFKDSALNEGLD